MSRILVGAAVTTWGLCMIHPGLVVVLIGVCMFVAGLKQLPDTPTEQTKDKTQE